MAAAAFCATVAAVGTAGFGSLLFACSSTTVGTGGTSAGDDDDDDDAGRDSGTVVTRDAGADTSTPRSDSGRDAAGAEAGGGTDASCAPGDVSDEYAFVAPVGDIGACTSVQVSAYVAACGNDGTSAACDAFESTYASCFSCMQTDIDAGAWGAVVNDPVSGEEFANVGGCFAELDTSSAGQACAQAAESVRLCEIQACEGPCAGQTFDTFTACETAADDGVCEDFLSDYGSCLDDVGADAGTLCHGSAYDDTVTMVGNVLCVTSTH